MILKPRKNSKPKTRHPASSDNQIVESGPDSLIFDEAEGIFLRRTIETAAWSKGEPSPPGLEEKFKSTGRLLEFPDNQKMEEIGAQQKQLRIKIAGSPKLEKAFNFFLNKMEWDPETLLYHLYWDCDMMLFTAQKMVSREKKRKWPIERKDLQEKLKRIKVLALQIEHMGERLNSADEEHFPRQFRESLSNFRCSAEDLLRKLSRAEDLWRLHWKRWESPVRKARRASFYEQIRAKTGRYHADRLHRLVNAAREVQGIPNIERRAFTIWLNRLKSAMQER